MPSINSIKKGLRKKSAIEVITDDCYLSSGSTMVNLACSGRSIGAFIKGHYYFFVGDSDSGKTWLCLTCLAEACLNPAFKEYRLIYDATEHGAIMDWERFFGSRLAKRVEPPRMVKGEPIYSETAQDFYYHVSDAIDAGIPFIYILDSQDALSSKEEIDKFKKTKTAVRRRSRGEKVEKI